MGFLKRITGVDELPPIEKATSPDSFEAFMDTVQSGAPKWFKIATEIPASMASYLGNKYPDFEFRAPRIAGKPIPKKNSSSAKDRDLWVRYGGNEYFLARKERLAQRANYKSRTAA